MKIQDFKYITPQMIKHAEIIIEKNGVCDGMLCNLCPFNSINNINAKECSENYYSDPELYEDYILLNSCKEFLKMVEENGLKLKLDKEEIKIEDNTKEIIKELKEKLDVVELKFSKEREKNLILEEIIKEERKDFAEKQKDLKVKLKDMQNGYSYRILSLNIEVNKLKDERNIFEKRLDGIKDLLGIENNDLEKEIVKLQEENNLNIQGYKDLSISYLKSDEIIKDLENNLLKKNKEIRLQNEVFVNLSNEKIKLDNENIELSDKIEKMEKVNYNQYKELLLFKKIVEKLVDVK